MPAPGDGAIHRVPIGDAVCPAKAARICASLSQLSPEAAGSTMSINAMRTLKTMPHSNQLGQPTPVFAPLSLCWINQPNGSTERIMASLVNGFVLLCERRRITQYRSVGPPVVLRSHRPRHKPAAAIGTDIVQHSVHAISAERALITANPRLCRSRRQRLGAVLANGTKFKHGVTIARVKQMTRAKFCSRSQTACYKQSIQQRSPAR